MSNIGDARPVGEPVLVQQVLVGGAITDGPEIMAVLGNQFDSVALQWETAAQAEEHLAAMLADVRSRMPLPPVVELVRP